MRRTDQFDLLQWILETAAGIEAIESLLIVSSLSRVLSEIDKR